MSYVKHTSAKTADGMLSRFPNGNGKGNTRKRVCIGILPGLIVSVFLMFGHSAYAATNFVDAVGHWADDEIRTAVEHGYISGYPDGLFRPDSEIKRSEFVKAVNAAMGFTEFGNIAFEDVLQSDWYYDEVRKAASAGYVSGYGNGMWFAPDRPISREEAAAALYRLDDDKSLADVTYADMLDVEWSLDAVRHAFAMGYMTGFPDNRFYPQRNLTRAEVVAILNKFVRIDRSYRMITELSVLYATDLNAYFSVRSHTAGNLRWEIIPAAYPSPDAKQIAAGLMANGQPAPLAGRLKINVNDEAKFNTFIPNDQTYYANIPEYGGAYKLYAVVVGQRNKLSVVASVDFSTGDTGDWAEDWLAPLDVRAVTASTAVLDFKSNESGTLYYVVMPRTRGVPTQENIYNAAGWNADPADDSGNTTVVRDVAGAVTLDDLKPGTEYTVYAFVLKAGYPDAGYPAGRYPNWLRNEDWGAGAIWNTNDSYDYLGPGILSNVGSFVFRTSGQSAPMLASVAARFNDNGGLEIDVAASDAVNLYYIVRQETAGAVPPTPQWMKANGTNVAIAGSTLTANGGTLTVPGSISAAPPPPALPTTPYVYDTSYRLYAVTEGVGGGGTDSPAELSQVVWSDLFAKTAPAPMLDSLVIQPVGWGTPIFGPGVAPAFSSTTYNYPGTDGEGYKVPNSYKQVRVTWALPSTAPATASVRVNGTALPASGYIDLTMPADAGTPFQVKVDVSDINMQTVSYTVMLKENVPAVTQLYVADSANPNPLPDGNGNYEVTLQPAAAQNDVAVRMDLEAEMSGEFIVNGNVIGPVLPPNALNGWQFTVPLDPESPTDVTMKVTGPGPNPEVRTYTLRINY